MNDQDRERFLATLRQDDQFRAEVRRELLTEELLNLPQTVAQLGQDIRSLTQPVAQQGQDLRSLTETVAQQGQDLRSLTETVSTLIDVVAEQRQDLTALSRDVRGYMERTLTLVGDGFTAVRGEISSLRTDMDDRIAELRTDMSAGFTNVDTRFDHVNAEIIDIKRRLAS